MKLPQWFTRPPNGSKSKAPTGAELTALLEQADEDVARAGELLAAAAHLESQERTPEAVQRYEETEAEKNRLQRFRDRLRADLEAAQSREADEQRTKELAEADKAAQAASHAGVLEQAKAFAERRFDLYQQLAELDKDAAVVERELSGRAARARAIYDRHGGGKHVDDHSRLLTSHVLLVDMVDAHVATLAADDPTRRYFTDLVHNLAPNRNQYPRRATLGAQA